MPIFGGIKKGYPVVRKYSKRVAVYGQLIRPYTLVAPIVAGIFGGLLPIVYTYGYVPHGFILNNLYKFILLVLVLACVQAGGQAINQAMDVEIDKINKPYRPVASGEIRKEDAIKLGLVLLLITLVASAMLNLYCFLFSAIGVFLAIYYSAEPIRAKKRHWIINLSWQALARGFLPFLITWCVFGALSNLLPWVLATSGFFWVFAYQATKDFVDFKGDKKFGIKTLVVVRGPRGAIETIKWLGLVAIWSTCLLWFVKSDFAILTVVFALLHTAILHSLEKDITLSKFENNLAWLLFYFGLGLMYILTFTILLL